MATARSPEVKLSSPAPHMMTKEMRLSPRCLLSPSHSMTSSGLSSPGSRRFSSSSSNNHSRQSSMEHISSSFEYSRGQPPPPPPPPPPARHGRQGSVHSSSSVEISQYMLPIHSRQSSLDSGRQFQHQPQLHQRPSSLDQTWNYSLRQKFGQQLLSKKCNNRLSPAGNFRLGPQYSVLCSKVSPTSLDMGYHTMVNGHGDNEDDEESPVSSQTSISGGCRPKEKAGVYVDTHKMMATYTGQRKLKPSPPQLVPKNNHDTNLFDNLSDDLVAKIFSLLLAEDLSACARTCRRFYFLAWDPNLWQKISFSNGELINTDFALESILRMLGGFDTCPNVEVVNLNNCARLTDAGLYTLSKRCPELRRLETKNCKEITNNGLQAIVNSCSSLSYLDVSGCYQISAINCESYCETISSSSVVPSSTSCMIFLQYLDLSDCPRIVDAGLRMIVKNSPHLRNIFLRRCLNLTDLGLKYLVSHCLSIREISISDCAQITDRGLCELGKLGPNLRYLSVAKCEQVSDAGVKQVARLCYKLRYLNVRGCERVSDASMKMIAISCTRIKSLDIGKCDITDEGLRLLSDHCKNLKKLSVKSCEMVTDDGIQCIALACRGLLQFNIQDCPVTLEGYRAIKRFCKNCIIEHTNPGFF